MSLLAGICTLACGSKTDPGGGTQTLTALVEVTRPSGEGVDRTVIEVDLRSAGGNPIAQAQVRLEDVDRGGETTAEGEAPGSFRGSFNGYARTIRIDLETPDGDALHAQLQGPAPHIISRPPDDAFVRRGDFESLKVTWDASETAEAVELQAGTASPVRENGDDGEAELPLAPLLDGPQVLRVTRETTVDLAGGIPGSKMRSRYEVEVEFTLQP